MLKSSELARELGCSAIYLTAFVKRLKDTKEAIVLRSLLKMLQLMHTTNPQPRYFVQSNGLYEIVTQVNEFAQLEGQVVVCQIANQLLSEFEATSTSPLPDVSI